MPVHDWSRVHACIFHDFHCSWISELSRALNSGILHSSLYALIEPHAVDSRQAIHTFDKPNRQNDTDARDIDDATEDEKLIFSPPKVRITAEADLEFYRRKQSSVVIRHAAGDRVVAIIEVVSPGNKIGRAAVRAFVEKAAELLEKRIHLLILDLLPPGTLDPQGVHGLIWEELGGEEYTAPPGKPLTLAAYESSSRLRAFVEPFAVGDQLSDMPLILEPDGCILVPSEATYERAFAAVPARWRRVLER